MTSKVTSVRTGWDIEAISSPLFELDSRGRIVRHNHAFRALASRVSGDSAVDGVAIASLFNISADYWLNLLSSENFLEVQEHMLTFVDGGGCRLIQTVRGVSKEDSSRRFMVSWEIQKHFHNAIDESPVDRRLSESLLMNTKVFTVHYQPQVSFQSRQVVGIEALLRWDDPELGMVSPAEFVPAAERLGLIEILGEMVIDKVSGQIAAWSAADILMPKIAVNVSPDQLVSGRLIAYLESAFNRYGISPSSLGVEITEAVMMADPAGALNILSQIRKMGVKLSIDDFGTGYSSLTYLKDLPIDTVKIDRSFITPLETSDDAVDIVHSIIDLAHSLGLQVIAEGVENVKQFEVLKTLRCDFCQGYLTGKPMPAEELLPFMEECNRGAP